MARTSVQKDSVKSINYLNKDFNDFKYLRYLHMGKGSHGVYLSTPIPTCRQAFFKLFLLFFTFFDLFLM